ncbi:hypothetical protein OHB00_16740 [Streptomyces sp. NBC_00631]|uniref:hypothetical protein n=1 Tax=Streptomyces sp. NBC_00631 TaxID=2975793 RepID=UPI0030E4E20F
MSDDGLPDGWEAHERRLWEAYRRGEWCEDVPEVRAEVLRWLLVAAAPGAGAAGSALRPSGGSGIGPDSVNTVGTPGQP